MALLAQIANNLYDGSYTVVAGQEAEINVGAEIDAIRPIPNNTGYVNLAWSARFSLTPINQVRGYYDSRLSRGIACLGWYEIRYGLTTMERYAIDAFQTGTPKVTGVYDGATINSPGDTYVVGNGANLISVNIGSDRPYRGDTLRWFIEPGVTGTIFLAVNTGFVDNLSNTNKYIIHP